LHRLVSDQYALRGQAGVCGKNLFFKNFYLLGKRAEFFFLGFKVLLLAGQVRWNDVFRGATAGCEKGY